MEGSSLVWARYLVSGIALARKATTKSARGRGHKAAAPDRSEDNGRARGLCSRRPRDPSESFAFARLSATPLRGERARAKPAHSFGVDAWRWFPSVRARALTRPRPHRFASS